MDIITLCTLTILLTTNEVKSNEENTQIMNITQLPIEAHHPLSDLVLNGEENGNNLNKAKEENLSRVKRQFGYYPYYARYPYPLPIFVGLGGFGGRGFGFGGRGFGGRGFGGRGFGGRGFGGRGFGGRGIGGRGIGGLGRGGIGGGRGGRG